MKLELEKYSTKSVLMTYEGMLCQHLGCQMFSQEEKEAVPLAYIFEEICVELRMQYLAREDRSIEEILEVENKTIQMVSATMNIPDKKIAEYGNEMIEKSKQLLIERFPSLKK